MSRYATAGNLPIDNNPAETIICAIALGGKNRFFTGSDHAGKRAAAIQALLGTAKLNGHDPAARVRDTLEKLPTCLNSQIDSLLLLRAEPLLETTPPKLTRQCQPASINPSKFRIVRVARF